MSEAKEYLERIRKQDKAIDKKLDELANLNSIVNRITPVMNMAGAAAGGNQDKLGATIAKIVDLQEEINRDVDILVDKKREAYQILYKLEDEIYYKILEMRYLQYMTFEQIAVELNCSRRWAEIKNGRALEEYDRLLKAVRKNSQ